MERIPQPHVTFAQNAAASPGRVVAHRWTLTVPAADVYHEHGQWHHETDAERSARAVRTQPAVYRQSDDAPPHRGQPADRHRAGLSWSRLPLTPGSLGERAGDRLHRVGVHRLVRG